MMHTKEYEIANLLKLEAKQEKKVMHRMSRGRWIVFGLGLVTFTVAIIGSTQTLFGCSCLFDKDEVRRGRLVNIDGPIDSSALKEIESLIVQEMLGEQTFILNASNAGVVNP